MTTLKIAAAIAVLMLVNTAADARGGSCDGFHRCRCGVTAARLAGLPLNYNGMNLKMARTYYQFPRTSCHAGAIGIPHAHHVYTVRTCNGDGTAVVTDDAGTYTRSVRGNVFVDANGNGTTRTASAKSHRRHHRMASIEPQPVRWNSP